MEVNLPPNSSLVQHLISAIEKDTLVLLNERFKKTTLIYFIIKESLKIHNKSCLLVKSSTDQQTDFKELQSLTKALSNLCFYKRESCEQQNHEDSKGTAKIFTSTINKILLMLSEESNFEDLSLIIIDLCDVEILDLEILKNTKFILDAFKSCGIRITVIATVGEYLDDQESLQGFLDNLAVMLNLHYSVDNDLMMFSNNGNIVEICQELYKEESPNSSMAGEFLKYFHGITEFLAVLQNNSLYANQGKFCFDLMRDLEMLLQQYGLLALCEALEVARACIHEWENSCINQHTRLILRYMESQLQVIDKFAERSEIKNNSSKEIALSGLIKPSLIKLIDYIEELFQSIQENSIANGQKSGQSCFIITESDIAAKSLYHLLLKLQISSTWPSLHQCNIVFLDGKSSHQKYVGDFVIYVAAKSCDKQVLGRIACSIYFNFDVPCNYQELLQNANVLPKNIEKMVFMISTDDRDSAKRLKKFQEIQMYLVSKSPSYVNPKEEQRVIQNCSEKLKSFVTKSKFELAAERSIEVVNRYCKFLNIGNTDLSVCHSAETKFDKEKGKVSAHTVLHLPVSSMWTKSINGPWVTCDADQPCSAVYTMVLSRMAACLQACELLFSAGELSENMEPSRKIRNTGEPTVVESDGDVIALSQKKQYHKQIPRHLLNSFPKQNQQSCLYVVNTQFIESTDYQVLSRYIGFCTMKEIPKIPSLLVYNRGKKEILSITKVSSSVFLDEKSILKLSAFSYFILAHILGYQVPYYPEDEPANGVLWTVVRNRHDTYEIDYEFLESTDFPRNGYTLDKLKMMASEGSVSPLDAVIFPAHRYEPSNAYYACDTCTGMIVDDAFPDAKVATSYIDYFKDKYGIDLSPGGCMLEIHSSHKNLNFLNQRLNEQKNDATSKRKQKSFLPLELCAVHPIPKHLWEQILAIPVIIYRVSSILLVNELQVDLFENLGLSGILDETDLADNMSKPMLGLDSPVNSMIFPSFWLDSHCDKRGAQLTYITAVESRLVQENQAPANWSRSKLIGEYSASANKRDNKHFAEHSCMPASDDTEISLDFMCETRSVNPKQAQTHTSNQKAVKSVHPELGMDHKIMQKGYLNVQRSDKGPSLSLLLAAFTTASSNDIFHHERLEFLGDAFVNAFVTIQLFRHHALESENVLSKMKSARVSNVKLFEQGQRLGLWKYIVDDQFDFKLNPMILAVLGCKKCEICAQQTSYYTPDNESLTEDMQDCAVKQDAMMMCDVHDANEEIQPLKNPASNIKQGAHCELSDKVACLFTNCFAMSVRKKAIADSVEALVGLLYLCNGEEMAVKVMNWLGFDVCCIPGKNINIFEPACSSSDRCDAKSAEISREEDTSVADTDYHFHVELAQGSTRDSPYKNVEKIHFDSSLQTHNAEGASFFNKKPIPSRILEEFVNFESQIGYTFKNKYLLYEALLHPSYLRQLACDTYCNQRMEFLGDALITLLVTRCLCLSYPKAKNAELSVMRSVIVNSRTFATVAAVNNYHKYLMFISSDLAFAIQQFVKEVEDRACKGNLWPTISAEELPSYHTLEYREDKRFIVNVPKDLDDVFESVAAAIYIDSENVEDLWKCYCPMLKGIIGSLPPP